MAYLPPGVSPFLSPERAWLETILSLGAFTELQFWAALLVFFGCVAQLHLDRKFVWPPAPGRLTIWGYRLGLIFGRARLAMTLSDLGQKLDFAMTLIGRLGIAVLGALALIAIDDAISSPKNPRPILDLMMCCIVLVQARSLTTASPQNGIFQINQ